MATEPRSPRLAEMKRALEDAVDSEVRGAKFDRDDLFRAFKRAVYQKCCTWERAGPSRKGLALLGRHIGNGMLPFS